MTCGTVQGFIIDGGIFNNYLLDGCGGNVIMMTYNVVNKTSQSIFALTEGS